MPSQSVKIDPNTFAMLVPTAIRLLNAILTEGAAIASATTVNLDTSTGYFAHITGTTAISAFTLADGNMRVLVFDGACLISTSSNLILPNDGNNITTAVNDIAVVIGEGGGVTRMVWYQRKDGKALQAANPFNQSLNTGDTPSFNGATLGGPVDNTGGSFNTNNLTFATVGGGADTPAADGTYALPTSITIVNGVIIAIS